MQLKDVLIEYKYFVCLILTLVILMQVIMELKMFHQFYYLLISNKLWILYSLIIFGNESIYLFQGNNSRLKVIKSISFHKDLLTEVILKHLAIKLKQLEKDYSLLKSIFQLNLMVKYLLSMFLCKMSPKEDIFIFNLLA